jgi:hypothetical protein
MEQMTVSLLGKYDFVRSLQETGWSSFIPEKNPLKLSMGTLITNLFS